VFDRTQEPEIRAPEAREQLRVRAIGLAMALRDQGELIRIRHDHGKPASDEKSAHPRRVTSGLDYDGRALASRERRLHRRGGRVDDESLDHAADVVEDADVAAAISQVHADRHGLGRDEVRDVLHGGRYLSHG